MKKLLVIERISKITSIIMAVLLFSIHIITNGIRLNGIDLLFILSILLINPVHNLFRYKIIKIKNIVYHFMLLIINIYIICISVYTIYLWIVFWLMQEFNLHTIIFVSQALPMLLAILLCYISSFVCEREVTLRKENNTRMLYIFIFLSSLIYLIPSNTPLQNVFIVSTIILYLIMFISKDKIYKKKELLVIYIITIIFMIFAQNLLTLILIVQALINLYKFKNDYIE